MGVGSGVVVGTVRGGTEGAGAVGAVVEGVASPWIPPTAVLSAWAPVELPEIARMTPMMVPRAAVPTAPSATRFLCMSHSL